MQKTNEILNWHFNSNELKNRAEHLFSSNTKNNIKKLSIKLNEIAMNSDGNRLPSAKLIEDIYRNFQTNKNKDYQYLLSLFSTRDIRILVWALDYKENEEFQSILLSKDLSLALKIILDKWRNSYLIGLWHVLLRNWVTLNKANQQFEILKSVIKNLCNNYTGKRNDIFKIISNLDIFLNNNSPRIYAEKLLKKQILLSEAHQLINQKESILGYSYYSQVATNYLTQLSGSKTNSDYLTDVYLFLKKHNSKQVTLIICSLIINNKAFNRFSNIIKHYSLEMIGDPIKQHLWKYTGLTPLQEQSIENARRKLNTLLNKQLIKIFFEKLVQDGRRKEYWLKFIDKIDNIKFAGNRSNYSLLKGIESISKQVDSRYKITSRYQSTSALIIYSKGFVFVEFTDVGALYIYKQKNFNVNLNTIHSIQDLKIRAKNDFASKNAQNGYVQLYQEGRITHQGNWELRVNTWMKRYYNHLD